MDHNNILSRNLGWVFLIIGILLLYFLRDILIPFYLAMAFAFLMMPLVNRLERFMSRPLAAITVFCVCFLGGLTLIFVLGRMLYNDMIRLVDLISRFLQNYDFSTLLPFLKKEFPKWNLNWKDIALNAVNVAFQSVKAATGVAAVLFGLIIMPVYSFYLLKDSRRLVQDFRQMLPAQNREDILSFFHEVRQILRNFIQGQITISLLDGLVAGICFFFLGIDYALLLGVLIAVTSVVPFVGPLLSFTTALLVALATTHSFWYPLGVLATWVLVILLESIVFQPKIMGSKMNMHPLIIILSIFIWGTLLGFLGILLAVPITAVLQVVYRRLVVAPKEPAVS